MSSCPGIALVGFPTFSCPSKKTGTQSKICFLVAFASGFGYRIQGLGFKASGLGF